MRRPAEPQLPAPPTRRRVLALTQGRDVPSRRFRVAQYADALRGHGIDLVERPSGPGAYPPARRSSRPAWLAATLLDRVPAVVDSWRADVTLLQRELVSTLRTLEGVTGRPRVLDVDDAIWLSRGGAFAARIARGCDAVICGNPFLADYFSRYASAVHVIPTAVDTDRYCPRAPADPDQVSSARPVLGWSGTSSGLPFLYEIEPALRAVLDACPAATLRVISDRAPRFAALPPGRVEFVRWTPEVEVEALRTLTVGLMPLRDDDWARGKCSYKMLLYMACGVPVVASPVGMNGDVLALGPAGAAATSLTQWADAVTLFLRDPGAARAAGLAGRAVVERHFALPHVAERLAAVLCGV